MAGTSMVAPWMRLFVLVLPLAVAEGRGVKVTVGSEVVGIVAPSFVAHGWEPWMATQAFHLFTNPAVVTAFGHLQGQTIRFGGITADWLDYVVDDAVSAPCTWGKGGRAPFTPGGSCPFSTGALTALLNLLDKAGVSLLFDLNVLVGRNCTQLEPGGGPDASSSSSSSSSAATSLPPLWLHLAYQNVHSPYVNPPDWECHAFPKMWDAVFANMLHLLDDGIRNVTAAIRSAGLWNNSLIIFSADNGGIGQ